MKFATAFALLAVSAAVVSAAPQIGTDPTAASATGSCSSGTPQCCGTVKDGDAARQASDLLGLGDALGAIGLSCQKIPVNIIGGAANVDNQCKNTAVCCTGERNNGLVQVGCTPLPVN